MLSNRVRQIFAGTVCVLTLVLFIYSFWGRAVEPRPERPGGAAHWMHKAQSGEVKSQCEGVRRLKKFHSPETLELVLGKLESEHVAVRIAAASTLGAYRDSGAVRPLAAIALADAEHPIARDKAIHALGQIGDPKALPALKTLLQPAKDDPQGWGLQSAVAIARLRTPEAQPLLIEALRSPDPWTRSGAIKGLAICGGPGAVDALRQLAERPARGLDQALYEWLFPYHATAGEPDIHGPEKAEDTEFRALCRRAITAINARLARQEGG